VTWTELMSDPIALADRLGAFDLLDWNLEILLQVINAVRFAHSRGILHRDLKPDNVMIGEFGEVYLVDWGIAAALSSDPSGRIPSTTEVAGRVAGTPAYLAPEALGPAPPTVRTDVYGLGAILYEIICGRPPHPGGTVLEVLTNVASRVPELPATPVELVAICRRAIAVDPEDRQSSADELRLEIIELIRHRDSTKLSDQAALRQGELDAHIKSTAIGVDDKRQVLYNLLGECRFGFGAALSAWPDNQTARDGLRDAVCAVASFELASDNPAAAKALVAGVDDIPAELSSSIADGLRIREAERRRFEALSFDVDLTVGNRTRTFLTIVLGTLWTLIPLAIEWLDRTRQIASTSDSYFRMALITGGMIILILGLSSWARASIFGTRLNRLLFFALMATLSVQMALLGGTYLLGVSPVVTQVMFPLVWFAGAAMFAMAGNLRALPLAGGYLAAFLLSAWGPEHRFFFAAAANLITTVNALWLWRNLGGGGSESGSSSARGNTRP
jgi:serine/threonine-protein kinase